ncbi:phosphatidylinositol kinase- protein kinase tor1 [Ceratobasidium sp. 394]|nr:phosphatidylinositol kinase- protein kinase tor1 [Ceratobasidium sp. 394]
MFTYKELLKRGGMLLQHSYPEASENILRLRQHRDGMVRRVCIVILPELAAYDAESFTSKHMRNIITHLLMVTVKPTSPDERGLAFKMIGALAKALQTGIMVMMDKIVERIHEALTTYVKKTSPPVDPVFDCIKKLAKALGPLFARHAQSLLDVMFSHKLTEGLKRALDAIIHGVPALAPDIKERLLQLLTMTLCGRRYHPLGSPEAHTGISLPAEVKAMLERHGYETITLAIHILGTSDFAGHGLSEVVRVCIIPYLSDEHAILRQTAALSACTLIAVDPVCFQTSDYSVGILMDMLDRLLTLAVADQDPTVRRTVLGALDISEKDRETRREAMRALGILGAVDPYKHAHNLDQADQAAQDTANLNHIDLTAIAADTNKEEYSSTVVFSALVGILKTPSLSSHHPSAIDAIMSICKTQGLKILGYLPQVMPVFFHVIRTARSQTQVYHLQQLGLLVGILGQHTRNYLPEILKLIGELWGQSPLLEPFIIALIENLARGFAAEFHQYIPTIIGPMLHIFEHESPEKSQAALTRALQAIVVLAPGVDPALVLPVMLRTAERADAPTTLRRAAITAVSRLAERCDLADHASRIIHPLLRILSHSGNDLRIAVMDAICTLMQIFGPDFVVLVPTIDKCLQANRIIHPPYTNLAQKMLKNIPIPLYIPSDYLMDRLEPVAEAAPLDVNQQHLRSAWDTSQISTGEDWREWIRRFAIECLKESPSHALRSCRILADSYMPLLKELFSISFFRCYFSLAEDLRDELDRVLEYALIDPRSPADVCHMILNAAEFMEHDDK